MRILAIGDIVGYTAIEYLRKNLWALRDKQHINFVVANGENACDIHGIGEEEANLRRKIREYGV